MFEGERNCEPGRASCDLRGGRVRGRGALGEARPRGAPERNAATADLRAVAARRAAVPLR